MTLYEFKCKTIEALRKKDPKDRRYEQVTDEEWRQMFQVHLKRSSPDANNPWFGGSVTEELRRQAERGAEWTQPSFIQRMQQRQDELLMEAMRANVFTSTHRKA